MNHDIIEKYVFLFLGWPLFGNNKASLSQGRIDRISFEIDLANEIYLKISEEHAVSDYPYGLAYQQKFVYPSIVTTSSGRDSLSKNPHMLSPVVEESEQVFYQGYGSKMNPIDEVKALITQILFQMKEDGSLDQLKEEWGL
jgi:ABC-type amino acid transport substrate-binding protein